MIGDNGNSNGGAQSSTFTLCTDMEVISELLIGRFSKILLIVNGVELGFQLLWRVTLFLAKHHSLVDQLDLLVY